MNFDQLERTSHSVAILCSADTFVFERLFRLKLSFESYLSSIIAFRNEHIRAKKAIIISSLEERSRRSTTTSYETKYELRVTRPKTKFKYEKGHL